MRIATHISDLDGLTSAAIFLRAMEKKNISSDEIQIDFLSVSQAQSTLVAYDYVFDLPKPSNAKCNIDHHNSNYVSLQKTSRLTPRDRVDPAAPAAAKLVYEYFLTELKDDKIAMELRDLGVAADTANLAEEFFPLDRLIKWYIKSPESLRRLCLSLKDYGKRTISIDWVNDAYSELFDELERIKSIMTHFLSTQTIPEYLIIDTREVFDPRLTKEVIPAIFHSNSQCRVLAVISYNEIDQKFSVSFRINKVHQSDSFYDVGAIAERLGGGGHRAASACRFTDFKSFIPLLKAEFEGLVRNKGESSQYYKLASL